MAQNLGELIDKENELLKGAIKNVGSRLKLNFKKLGVSLLM